MKYVGVLIIAIICLIVVNCLIPVSTMETIPELVIRPYMFEMEIGDPNTYTEQDKFNFETLEVGVSRILAPVIGTDVINLCFYIEFDGGIVEVISDDKDVQLSMTGSSNPWGGEDFDNRIFDSKLRVGNSGYISMNPLGSGCGTVVIFDDDMRINGEVGKKYHLTINAYEFMNTEAPIITAKIILTQLNDDMRNTCVSGSSRFFSVELVSYEYSETYLIKH